MRNPELQLNVRMFAGIYHIDVQFIPAGSSAPVRLFDGPPLALRLDDTLLQSLTATQQDPHRYGEHLTSWLFHDPRLVAAFHKAVSAALGGDTPLRLRLCLDEHTPLLHELRWETLREPGEAAAPLLSVQERIRFSRFLSSHDIQPLRPRSRTGMKAIVAVANPANLTDFRLSPIDAVTEVSRIQASLASVPVTVLGSGTPQRRATRDNLISALRDGPDILYLACHGRLVDGAPYLCLEDIDGRVDWVSGTALAADLHGLERRPLLVVLAACEGAGDAAGASALTALGPQLAAAGVAAVIAMQGNIAMDAIARFMPVFFRELLRDGQVDRAVAAARATLLADGAWWQPVLWLRMLDGQLWVSEASPPLPHPAVAPYHVPLPPTPLVGRAIEIAEVVALLKERATRLVTLTGPGGTGKTRLALEVAAALRDNFADGIWFVDLTPIRDPELVLPAIAKALGLPESGDQLRVQLHDHLRARALLLVIDNVEQVINAAPLLADLLTYAPGLQLLVTSRSLLRLTAEHEFRVDPLEVPDQQAINDIDDSAPTTLLACAAVALFVQHARTARPSFTLTRENAQAVATLCVRLDGLPLAIELAAARIKLLTPVALLARLSDRFRLLEGGMRDHARHQQTLRSTIDWSYELLDAGERELLAYLAVFSGGCTLEAAEVICGQSDVRELSGPTAPALDVLDGLTSLLEKSLIRQIDEDAEGRFIMLESIREYALEKLARAGAETALRRRHASYFLDLAEQAEPKLSSAEQGRALSLLETEHGNLRAALSWALGQRELELAARLSGALWIFWYLRGHLTEGRRWLGQVLPDIASVEPALRAKVLHGAGGLAYAQCDYASARAYYEASLALRQALGDQHLVARLLNNLAIVARDEGRYGDAQALYEETLALLRALGDQWGVANVLNNLGLVVDDQGDHARSVRFYTESLALRREMGDEWSLAQSLNNLGLSQLRLGNEPQARALLEESLSLARKLDDRPYIAYASNNLGRAALARSAYRQAAELFYANVPLVRELGDTRAIAACLEGIGAIAGPLGRPLDGARLWGAAEALREDAGIPLPPADRSAHERGVAATRVSCGAAAWATAWAAGRALGIEQACAEALKIGVAAGAVDWPGKE